MDDYAKKIPVPEGHHLVLTSSEWKGARKGQDIDIHCYDVVNETGEVVEKYEVQDSTSVYPPFGRTVTARKVS